MEEREPNLNSCRAGIIVLERLRFTHKQKIITSKQEENESRDTLRPIVWKTEMRGKGERWKEENLLSRQRL